MGTEHESVNTSHGASQGMDVERDALPPWMGRRTLPFSSISTLRAELAQLHWQLGMQNFFMIL